MTRLLFWSSVVKPLPRGPLSASSRMEEMEGMQGMEGTAAPRERLIEAAEAQFRRFGFRRTTIDDITGRAGTGKGSLYLHFDSKQALYAAVVEASVERFVQRASGLLEGPGTVPERLRSLVELTIDHYSQDELLHASLFGGGRLVEGDVSPLPADGQRTRIPSLLRQLLQ